MSRFSEVQQIVNRNPVMQFAKKAVQSDPVLLSSSHSPTAVGAGLGQEFQDSSDEFHAKAVKRQDIFFNMMKFNMQTRLV